ncbi:GGDEF domain-containing protein [Turicibacter sanguinis]|uniref:tetratricopeptide repeat-containing diguanylate cyclase n=2 Tax=Turicibacter sanguinis TaxID=154288 RepID=UPI00232E30A7|nr:GGDEF domain-containing protein [Turicibacter sanguinis]MDB8576032.1 GGDEF domain-containing protein [Turicibacter sanguinis]MDB8579379.1 GGDEF domain-containing protein [Turicibacter sanguinis]MDB8585146.1 GGDEF domain-containing protein [Turicibacter sanguinis]MDB8588133.1 GGDEF domain-containing protein [Turicibacter sanguinis]MDB8598977.1 GGDEF domain-containing protein [Turicibacter sanguinis]
MKNKTKIMISCLLFPILLLSLFFLSRYSSDMGEKKKIDQKEHIIVFLEESIQNQVIGTEEIESINQYLLETTPDSEYYFIKGYLDYISSDYKQAIQNFNLAVENIEDNTRPFVKIYTYILLNESLQMENQYELLSENCKIAIKYISEDKTYKNDVPLLWRTISVLLDNKEQIQESISILSSYLDDTKGLTNESIIKLTTNIGQLYSLIYRYSDAMYNYLDAIHFIDSNPSISEGAQWKIKLLTIIGDINFSLNEYENAINYYNEALSINLDDKNLEALSKSLTLVNKCQAYIELELYDLAIQYSKELNKLLPYLPEDIKDDIEILMNNLLASANIHQNNLEEAKKQLTTARELLEQDKIEYSLYKDVFISLTYAQFYKEKKLYDQALETYHYVLTESINKGLGLEEQVYEEISKMYEEKQDFANYVKYNELYIKQKNENTQIFKEDYMEYTTNLYESHLLEEKAVRYQINFLIMLFSFITASIVILVKTRSVKRLRHLSFTDSMTNLYNRKYLDYYMSKNKKKLFMQDLSIIIIDIDYFKKYNDNYGHIEGDRIIKEVANTLKENVRKDDIAVRYGGEEMVLVLPNVSSNNAEAIAQKIQMSLQNKKIEHKYSEIGDLLTISIGIYTTNFSGQDVYELINKADSGLYRAKQNGRNRYEIVYD